jgi:flagellar M-ring protein FliF
VTVGNNLPNNNANNQDGGRTSNENTVRTEETVNYEISRTVRNHTQVGGRVKRLSVAVLVGGRESAAENVEGPAFTPLTPEELDEIAGLVRSAIGYDAERGDSVDVKNMPFVLPALEEIETSIFDLTKNDILRLVELGVLALLALLAIFLVVRPVLAKLMPEPVMLDPSMSAPPDGDGSNLPVALDEHGRPVGGGAGAGGSGGKPNKAANEQDRPELAEFEDKARGDLIRQIRSVIEARPDDSVAVVRLWMDQSLEATDV